jgi:hypothetical protein
MGHGDGDHGVHGFTGGEDEEDDCGGLRGLRGGNVETATARYGNKDEDEVMDKKDNQCLYTTDPSSHEIRQRKTDETDDNVLDQSNTLLRNLDVQYTPQC